MEMECVAKFVYDKKMTKKNPLTIETRAGIKTLYLSVKDKKVKSVRVDMGEAIIDAKKVPVISNEKNVINKEIKVLDKKFKINAISMGNPHCVIFVKDTKNFDVEKYGKVIENNLKLFPKKANVEFVKVIDKNNIQMRVWERGSGETLACGTGACASAVACVLNEKTNREVTCSLLGGKLKITWDKDTNHVFLEGGATTVFDGVFNDDFSDK